MEIKPSDKEIVDRKDLRYRRKITNKGIKDIDKQAYRQSVSRILSQAGVKEIIDAINKHVADNRCW